MMKESKHPIYLIITSIYIASCDTISLISVKNDIMIKLQRYLIFKLKIVILFHCESTSYNFHNTKSVLEILTHKQRY